MAKAIYKQEGKTIDYTNTGVTDIGYMDIIDLTSRIGVACDAIPAGKTGSITLEGVYEIPADDSKTFAVGAPVYWNSTEGVATDDATKTPAGFAVVASTGDDTITIKLGDRMATDTNATLSTAQTFQNKTIDAASNTLKNVALAYAGNISRAELIAGKTLVAGAAGKTIRVLGYTINVNGAFSEASGTSVVLQDTNDDPVVIATLAKAALTDGAVISSHAVDSDVTNGAGLTGNLTAGKGIAVAPDADWDGGTSIDVVIQYMYV